MSESIQSKPVELVSLDHQRTGSTLQKDFEPPSNQFDTWPRIIQHKSDSPRLDQKIMEVKQLLSQKSTDQKAEKIQKMLTAFKELEQNLDFLKRWFGHVEAKLNQPILVHSLDEDKFNDILEQHQDLHQDIVNHCENVQSVMQLSELLLQEADVFSSDMSSSEHSRTSPPVSSAGLDLAQLKKRCTTVGKRWDVITAQSHDRLTRINKAWDNSRKFVQSCDEFKRYIETQSQQLQSLEHQALSLSPTWQNMSAFSCRSAAISSAVQNILQKIDEQRVEFRKSLDQLESINKQYRVLSDDVVIFEIASSSTNQEMATGDGLRNKLELVNRLWSEVDNQFDVCEAKLKRGLKQGEEFAQVKQTLMIWLMDLDIRLTKVDLFASQDDLNHRLQQLKDIKKDIARHQGRIDYLNLIGQKLANNRSSSGGSFDTEEQNVFMENEINDFNRLAKSVTDRVAKLEQKLEYEKKMSKPFDSTLFTKSHPLDAWESTRHLLPKLNNKSQHGLRSHLLLTSSTTDLKTFDMYSMDSRDNFMRKCASMSALNRRRKFLNSTAANTEDNNSSIVQSRTTCSNSNDVFSRNQEHLSIPTSSERSDVSSLRFRGHRLRDQHFGQVGENERPAHASSRRNFFAHRPVQASFEKNDPFNKRHNRSNSIQASQPSRSSRSRSPPPNPVLNNLANSGLDLDWDPYEPMQLSTDNLAVTSPGQMRFASSCSNSANVDVNHNKNHREFSSKYLNEDRQRQLGTTCGGYGSVGSVLFSKSGEDCSYDEHSHQTDKVNLRVDDLSEVASECVANLDAAEEVLRCETPSGEACDDAEKQAFGTVIASTEACVDVVKSLFGKLQHSSPNELQQRSDLNTVVKDCMKRWDVVKRQAGEKRKRLKRNYQLWHQFLADFVSLREWVLQQSSMYGIQKTPRSHKGADESEIEWVETNHTCRQLLFRLGEPCNWEELRGVSLHQLEQLIRSHRDFLSELNLKKTTLMSITLYMERDKERSKLSVSLKADIKQLCHQYDMLCVQCVKSQQTLQKCLVENSEVKRTVNDIIKWLHQLEVDLDLCQKKSDPCRASNEMLSRDRYLLLKQLKSELETYQPRVNALRITADQLLTISLPASHVQSFNTPADVDLKYSKSSLELRERLSLLANRVKTLHEKLDCSIDETAKLMPANNVQTRTKTSVSDVNRRAPVAAVDTDEDLWLNNYSGGEEESSDLSDTAEFHFIDNDLIPDPAANAEQSSNFEPTGDDNNNNNNNHCDQKRKLFKNDLDDRGSETFPAIDVDSGDEECRSSATGESLAELLDKSPSHVSGSVDDTFQSGRYYEEGRNKKHRSRHKHTYPVISSVQLEGMLGELCVTSAFLPPVLDYTAWLKQPRHEVEDQHIASPKVTCKEDRMWSSKLLSSLNKASHVVARRQFLKTTLAFLALFSAFIVFVRLFILGLPLVAVSGSNNVDYLFGFSLQVKHPSGPPPV